MKQLIFSCVLLISFSITNAQYKKASFFNKDGRVYELGVVNSLHSNGDGKPGLSLFYCQSLETDKKLTGLSEIEFMLKGKFAYNGNYTNAIGTNLSGKIIGDRKPALIIKYGLQYRFTNTESAEQKAVPYARLSLVYGYAFGSDNYRDANGATASPDGPYPSDTESFIGAEAGGGLLYNFTNNFGLRIGASYRPVFYLNGSGSSYTSYHVFKSHPGISLSLKYKIFAE